LNHEFESIWIRSPDSKYWVYSLSSPTQVTVQCQEAGPPQNYEPTRQITLSNTGILPDSSSCHIYAEKFKLLPHSLGRLTVSLNKTHVVLPNVDDILNIGERELLQNHPHALADLRPVENIIERATSRSTRPGLDVSRLTTTLRNTAGEESTLLPWIIGVTVGFMILLLITVTYLKQNGGTCWKTWRRIWIPPRLERSQHSVLSSQNTVQIELPLQIRRVSTESNDGKEVTEVTQDDERPLTPFFRRGRLESSQ
jgi:hypothetical protein